MTTQRKFVTFMALLVALASLTSCGKAAPKAKFSVQQNLQALQAAESMEKLTHENLSALARGAHAPLLLERLKGLTTSRAFSLYQNADPKTQLTLVPLFSAGIQLDSTRQVFVKALSEFKVSEVTLRAPGKTPGLAVSWDGTFVYPVTAGGQQYTIEFQRTMKYEFFYDAKAPTGSQWLVDNWVSSFKTEKAVLVGPVPAPLPSGKHSGAPGATPAPSK